MMELYKKRREKIMNEMGEGISLLYGAPSAHLRHPFRQDNNFYYLTGLVEADCILVLAPKGEKKTILFIPPRDAKKETWNGPMLGPEGAVEKYGIEQALPLGDFREKFKELLRNQPKLYYSFGMNEENDRNLHKVLKELRGEVRQGTTVPRVFYDFHEMIHEMRLVKDAHEIELSRKAASISARGHRAGMQFTRPGVTEYEVQAAIEYEFRKGGAVFHSFNSILAGGKNALVLHYEHNRDTLKDGDLLLMDAGAEYEYYTGDISRTIPVSGTFSEPQKEIYNLVRKAQRAVIDMVKPGLLYEELHKKSIDVILDGLLSLGILSGEKSKLVEEKKYLDFFMHGTGHWLGMDCHDVGAYNPGGKSRPLCAGMIFTVEPGLYIPYTPEVPEKYRGIGVRIEDNVLVTERGCEVLTHEIPSTVEEIEAIMKEEWKG